MMNKEKVEFSIIIPTFNREKLLSEALKSANKGLPPNGELVIINDGLPFTSHFWSLTSELEGNVTATSGHLGAGAARNLGAELALGQWLFFLDDDDLIAKDYWCSVRQYIVQKLSTDTKAYGFCRSTSHSDRNQMKTLSTTNANFQIYPQEGSLLKAKLAGLGQGFWISKSLFQEIGGINPDLKTNEDTDLCLRLLGAGAKCHKSDGVGAFIFSGDRGRTAAQSTTKRYSPKQRAYYFKHIIDTNADILATDPKAMHWLWKRHLKMAARSGGMAGMNNLWVFPKLVKSGKLSLALYWIFWAFISTFHRH